MRYAITNEWFTLFSFISLVLIVVAKQTNTTRFKDFISAIYSIKYINVYAKEKHLFTVCDRFLFANFCISISVFTFCFYSHFIKPLVFEIDDFLKLLLGLSSFFILRIFISIIFARIFDFNGLVKTYVFRKITYSNYSGILLWIVNLFLIYNIYNNKYILIVGTFLIALIYTLGFIVSFKKNQTKIKSQMYYFLLYICTLEIGSYIIIYKAFKVYHL